MLDKTNQESPVMQLVQRVDRCTGDYGLGLQGAPYPCTPPVPQRESVLKTLDGTLGLHNFIAQQFSMPEGMCGRVTGAVMGLINHLPNRRAIEILDIAEQDDVLEIGFGPGFALREMSKRVRSGTITGVDLSPVMVRQAQVRNRAAIQHGKLKLIQGTFERLPLESVSVNKILAVNVIYFCLPIGTALAEARRVLRPGGTMSIYATDCSSRRRLQFIGPETRQTFDRKGLEDFLRQSAFATDQIDIQTVWLPFGFRGLVARLCKR
ncbi:class I SAM-dependent methyltransferase [Mesorhizobium sp. B3-2-1]|uniref:class I SAM-dependent methyltransferase n=1 Tax=Mesorhizobium sp. B3-2-1 TaxID=2589891 RepID=UPI00112DDA7A|nr:class I SAM-dependent methyltransferase [Mesorhizobium sp. B3-2-1]TPI25063.1 class I SAM-dependent methyltransferase [Mesorhizobium sp. B3-2-1]